MDTRTKTSDTMIGDVVRAKCPYCGASIAVAIMLGGRGGKGVTMARCDDVGDGGCNRAFVARFEIVAIVEAAQLPFDEP